MPQPLQSYRVRDWFALNGDATLRLNYDLGPESVVLDVGGFEGEFAAAIHERYGCYVYIFEPHPHYLAILADKFLGHPKIKVLPYGLGDESGIASFSSGGDATSSFVEGERTFSAEIKAADEAFIELGIKSADLLKLNIEGAEYGVISRLSKAGTLSAIKNIQVQFHDFFEGSSERVKSAREAMIETHAPTYMFSFVWENWRLADGDTDADIRRNLFLSMDHIRERFSMRERQIDQMNEDAEEMRRQIGTLALKIEANDIQLRKIAEQTTLARLPATLLGKMKRLFASHS